MYIYKYTWVRMVEGRVSDSLQGIAGLCVANKSKAWKIVRY